MSAYPGIRAEAVQSVEGRLDLNDLNNLATQLHGDVVVGDGITVVKRLLHLSHFFVEQLLSLCMNIFPDRNESFVDETFGDEEHLCRAWFGIERHSLSLWR